MYGIIINLKWLGVLLNISINIWSCRTFPLSCLSDSAWSWVAARIVTTPEINLTAERSLQLHFSTDFWKVNLAHRAPHRVIVLHLAITRYCPRQGIPPLGHWTHSLPPHTVILRFYLNKVVYRLRRIIRTIAYSI